MKKNNFNNNIILLINFTKNIIKGKNSSVLLFWTKLNAVLFKIVSLSKGSVFTV